MNISLPFLPFFGIASISLAACAAGPPVVAQETRPQSPALSDTVKAAIANGLTMTLPGGPRLVIFYESDGSLGGSFSAVGGTWKAEGRRLCMDVPGFAENQCLTYPDGKKAGDSFTIDASGGPIAILIHPSN